MKGKNITYTPAEIVSAAKDGIVVSADGVYDYNQEEFQEQINADILEELRNIQLRISDLLPFNINYAGSNSPGGAANSSEKLNTDAGSSKKAVYFENGIPVEVDHSVNKDVPANAEFTDTKNTAGATNSNLKLFLIGSTELSENPQTYSRDSTYIGSDGYLYSGNQKVITDISHKADKANSVTNVEYNDKKITKTINGNTSDIVSINKIKEDLELNNVTNDSQVKRSEMGVANGVATLGNDGKVPSNQLPGYVDDVIELLDMSEISPQNYSKGDYYYNINSKKLFEALSNNSWDDGTVPSAGKIYTNLKNNKTYRWGGSEMAVISDTLAIGNTQGTAFDGKEGYDHVTNNDIHVTTEDKNNWNNKGTYSKPDLGIPKSDFHNDVLESLNKADTAIQQETDPTVPSWAKQPTKPSYDLDEVSDGANRKIPTKISELENDSNFTGNLGTVTKVKVGIQEHMPTNGVVELPAYPNTLPASDVYSWAKQSDKPSYNLDEILDGNTRKLESKVDKVNGKGLSTNDYTNEDKTKLRTIELGAQVHIAPTASEVKLALNVGEGTSKYLREDGTWLVPPDTTYLSKVPQENGYDVSLVTTGDKYAWNNKLDYISDLNNIRSNASKGAEAKEELIDYDIFIDLGLPSGTLWAKYNIGANKDTDYGNYYRYGCINKYNNNLTNYSGTENPLNASKDAATQTWGIPWHIPTRIQFIELIENTTYEWTTINGVNGGKFIALNGNYIFFPASGNQINGNLSLVGTAGDYLSSTPGNNDNIYCINIYNSNRNIYEASRDLGCSVRAVCETYPNKLSRKVDKVSGKDLSTNDYTNAEKAKLGGIEEGALVHISPTSTEVKNALGTTSGTNKYLREDGTWQVPNYTDVSYSNNKFSKTINGNSSDIVTVDTLKSDMNLNKVENFKAVSTEANLVLTDTEKTNARTNIGAGTSSLVIGTTTGTAADGKVVNDYINNTSNPHNVTKSLVGLGNVTNDVQVKRSEMGVANGVATLDENGHIEATQLEEEYQNLTAGNVVGTFSDESEVSFRPTAGAVDIESGKASKGAKLINIKGNTVAWNQLIRITSFPSASSGVSGTVNTDGTVTLNGTAITSGYIEVIFTSVHLTASHKVLFSEAGVRSARLPSSYTSNFVTSEDGTIITIEQTGNEYVVWLYFDSGDTFSNKKVYVQLIDLTLIYGAGNEPTTVAQFEADYERWFGKPLSYESYDEGSLRPVLMSGIKTTGFNQWDEEWELGAMNGITGTDFPSSNSIRSKSYIQVEPSTTYYVKIPVGYLNVYQYSADKSFLGTNSIKSPISNTTFLTNNDCKYIRCEINSSYGTTYNHDICINLHHSGARDGQYEPYWTSMLNVPITTMKGKLNGEGSSVVVFPDGLKKAGTVYDEIIRRGNKTYAIKRVGSVDLGTLTWRYSNSYGYFSTNNSISDACKRTESRAKDNLICAIYTPDIWNASNDKTIKFDTDAKLFSYNSAYSDEAAYKAAMSGVMLYYELATPEEYLLDDFELPQVYDVDDYGTEEVQLGTNGCAPVLDIKYGINAADTIKNLPHSYVSAVGEQNFLDAQKERARKNIGAVSLTDVAAVDQVIADAFAQQQAEINALRSILTDISSRINISVRLVDSEEYYKVGVPTILYCSGVPNASNIPLNWNSNIMGEWTGVPRFIGLMYIDISSSKLFMSKLLTNSTGDWFQV